MRTTRSLRASVVMGSALLLAVAAALWWNARRPTPLPIGVVVITLDTTRADRLSPYGFMDVSLPALERLAREGVVFEHASTVAPMTLPAHTSLFTGLLPPHHGVRDNADPPLDDRQTTLAEMLGAQGFKTGAFVGSIVLAPERGLSQGFNLYDSVAVNDRQGPDAMQRRADEVMDHAIRWLDSVGSNQFLLWTHLYDAHRPYAPPEPFRSTYAGDPYVGEIAFADSQIGRLLEALDQRKLLDRVVLVVAGDHGESLGDHGERDHGIFVYQEVLRVPLMIRSPALKPVRVGEIVRLTDVVPTVLDLLGLPLPKTDGVSLLGLMAGKPGDSELEAYSESRYPERLGWSPLYALRQGRFKLIDAPRPELYDLDRDPFETQNIYDERRSMADAMSTRINEIKRPGSATNESGPPTTVSPEIQARLAALGYVSSAVTHNPSDRSHRPDPKDCIGSHARMPGSRAVNPICGPGFPLQR